MAKADSIPPFPDDIDRDYFGAWLSGFTDGEGCFFLGTDEGGKHLFRHFDLKLRADDLQVVCRIQSYWRTGHVRVEENNPGSKDKPQARYRATALPSLVEIIVPHFHRFPLQAKKARDFVLWEQGVRLCFEANQRKRRMGYRRGRLPNYTREERTRFLELVAALREQREFHHGGIPLAPLAQPVEYLPLFGE